MRSPFRKSLLDLAFPFIVALAFAVGVGLTGLALFVFAGAVAIVIGWVNVLKHDRRVIRYFQGAIATVLWAVVLLLAYKRA